MGSNENLQQQKTRYRGVKTVVVTGAASGIGRAAALAFAREKANIVVTARRGQALSALAGELEQAGATSLVIPADITYENDVQTLARRAADTFGHIDVWVNNAAVTAYGTLEDLPSHVYRRVIEVNLFGYINGARAALPFFRMQKRGVLINVSSFVSRTGSPFNSVYAASKAAINVLAESLRMELGDMPDISVCTLLLGSIDTPLYREAANYTGKVLKPASPVSPAATAAQAIVALARHPKREVTLGAAPKAAAGMFSLLPGLAGRLGAPKITTDEFRDEAAPYTEGNLFRPMEQWSTVSGGWIPGQGGREMTATQKRLAIGGGVLGAGAGALLWASARGLIKFPFMRRRR